MKFSKQTLTALQSNGLSKAEATKLLTILSRDDSRQRSEEDQEVVRVLHQKMLHHQNF